MNEFQRYEKKFILQKEQYETLRQEMTPYLEQDERAMDKRYTICNIYYDTKDDQLIKKSVSKPEFKVKLRLRCYGEVTDQSIVYLELKKKLKGYVYKSRTLISMEDAHQLIHHKVFPLKKEYHSIQVLNEIYFFVQHKELIPRISISYDREAFYTITDPSVRITFDHNIGSRRDNLYIGRNQLDEYVLDPDMVVLEIKTPHAIPMWLTDLLTKHHLFSNSFSKYGTAFYDYMIANRKEDKSCLNPYLTFQVQASH